MSQTVEEKSIDPSEGSENGQNKCPKCGATDISLSIKKGVLRCDFCRFEFQPQIAEADGDISELEGRQISEGAGDIQSDELVTLKCESCGSEVVFDTESCTNARCHWCRNHLSLNSVVPNGAVPDMVLPFNVSKEAAKDSINAFVSKRRFFANKAFKNEFCADNVMGVYLPYMIIDVNSHMHFIGDGEHQTKCYIVGNDKHKETRYDAACYHVEREFDLLVDDLTVESSSKRSEITNDNTNNIINSIMPFDTENCVEWNANYIKGFSSEKRDYDVEDITPRVNTQVKDIARYEAHKTLGYYDRGVRWNSEKLALKGSKWKTAYFPVWLYSYFEKKGDSGLLHYVAVNARTKETMGSVPVNMAKLVLFSFLVEMLAFGLKLFVDLYVDTWLTFLLLAAGFIFGFVQYSIYRNTDERHYHEKQTRRQVCDMKKTDRFVKNKIGLRESRMDGANSKRVDG